jgi:hypothetical protein
MALNANLRKLNTHQANADSTTSEWVPAFLLVQMFGTGAIMDGCSSGRARPPGLATPLTGAERYQGHARKQRYVLGRIDRDDLQILYS